MAGNSSVEISTGRKAVETRGHEEASAMCPTLYTSLSSSELPGLGVRVTASGVGVVTTSGLLTAEPTRTKEGKSQLEPLTSDSLASGVWF